MRVCVPISRNGADGDMNRPIPAFLGKRELKGKDHEAEMGKRRKEENRRKEEKERKWKKRRERERKREKRRGRRVGKEGGKKEN